MSKKLWFYTKGKWKKKATLTNLRPMITRDSNVEDPVCLLLEKLDSNWFVDWSACIPIEKIDETTEVGDYPYTSKIPKRIRIQIQKAKGLIK